MAKQFSEPALAERAATSLVLDFLCFEGNACDSRRNSEAL